MDENFEVVMEGLDTAFKEAKKDIYEVVNAVGTATYEVETDTYIGEVTIKKKLDD